MNSFHLNNEYLLQMHGNAIGTRMAPFYANFFTGKLERKFLATQDKQFQEWWRYIDDILAIWFHGEIYLHTFKEELNCHHPTIKFKVNCQRKRLVFGHIGVPSKWTDRDGYTVQLQLSELVGTTKNVQQSFVPSNIVSLLIRPYALLWEGTGGTSAMPSSSSTSSLQSGKVTVSTISIPLSPVQEFLV